MGTRASTACEEDIPAFHGYIVDLCLMPDSLLSMIHNATCT